MRKGPPRVRIAPLHKARPRTTFRPADVNPRSEPLRVFRDLIIFRAIDAQLRNKVPPMFHVKHHRRTRNETRRDYINTNAHMKPRFTDNANVLFPVGSTRK
jgi:hypothetical protein